MAKVASTVVQIPRIIGAFDPPSHWNPVGDLLPACAASRLRDLRDLNYAQNERAFDRKQHCCCEIRRKGDWGSLYGRLSQLATRAKGTSPVTEAIGDRGRGMLQSGDHSRKLDCATYATRFMQKANTISGATGNEALRSSEMASSHFEAAVFPNHRDRRIEQELANDSL
jgi:hypothetical protein